MLNMFNMPSVCQTFSSHRRSSTGDVSLCRYGATSPASLMTSKTKTKRQGAWVERWGPVLWMTKNMQAASVKHRDHLKPWTYGGWPVSKVVASMMRFWKKSTWMWSGRHGVPPKPDSSNEVADGRGVEPSQEKKRPSRRKQRSKGGRTEGGEAPCRGSTSPVTGGRPVVVVVSVSLISVSGHVVPSQQTSHSASGEGVASLVATKRTRRAESRLGDEEMR